MRQIAALRYAPRRPAQSTRAAWSRLEEDAERSRRMSAASGHAEAPLIPLRHASLQRDHDRVRYSSSQTEVRRAASSCGSAASACISTQSGGLPPSRAVSDAGTDGPQPARPRKGNTPCVGPKSPVDSDQRVPSGASLSSTLWKRRSLGADTLRGLFPLMADFSTTRDHEASSRPAREGGVPAGPAPAVPTTRAKGKKDASRWGWGAWF